MKRKGFWVGFSYLLGLCAGCFSGGDFCFVFSVAIIAIGTVLFGCVKKYRRYILCCSLSVLVGIAVCFVYTEENYKKLIAYDGREVTVNGHIEEYDYIGEDEYNITIKGKINGINGKITFIVPDIEINYYDKVSVKGKVYKITDNINYCNADYMKSKGVFLRGVNAQKIDKTGGNANPLMREIKTYRDRLSAVISENCSAKSSAYLKAMLMGDKSELTRPMKTSAYRSGVGHIFAVSGTHLVIVTEMFGLLIKCLKSKRLKFLLTLAVIWGFAAFSGLSPSVVRAAVMMTAVKSGFILGRKSDCANSLGICAVILTVGCPYTAVNPSFLMSFAAAFTMGVIAPYLCRYVQNNGLAGKLQKYVLTSVSLLFVMLLVFGISFILVLCGGYGGAVILKIPDLFIGLSAKICDVCSVSTYCYIPSGYKILNLFMLLSCILPVAVMLKTKNVKKCCVSGMALIFSWLIGLNLEKMNEPSVVLCVLSDKNKCEYVLKEGNECTVFQCGNKVDNGGAERFIRFTGANKIRSVFCPGEYESASVNDDFPFAVSHIFKKSGAKGNIIKTGDKLDFGNFDVISADDGYIVRTGKTELYLQKNCFYINGAKIEIQNEDYPLIADIDKAEVRRVGYGFD